MSNAADLFADAGIGEDVCGRMTEKLSLQTAWRLISASLESLSGKQPVRQEKKRSGGFEWPFRIIEL